MTQPIDVAYVEVRADTKEFKTGIRKDVDKELKNTEKEADKTASHIGGSFKKASDRIKGFFSGITDRLSGAGTGASKGVDLLETGLEGVAVAGKSAASSVGTVQSALSGLLGGLSSLASSGPVGVAVLAAAFVALAAVIAAAAALLQSLITVASAGLALLPTLAFSAVAAFGVLSIAISGVADAFKEQSEQSDKAGASGVNNARQIADAQRGILQAQKDVIKAREDELKRIREIQTALFRARTTEARAIDDVRNAQLALQAARELNSPRAVTEAQLQLDEANASLLEAKDRTRNLAADKAKADKNGVEGSEQVQRALEQLRDSQDRLAAAQQSGAAALASQNKAFDGLTKSAQGFVTALVSAKTLLGPVKDAIQEAFFSGTGDLVGPVAQNIKDLQPELVHVADGFNAIFTEILKFLGSDEAEKMFGVILQGVGDFLNAIAPAVGPLLEAFTSLAADGSSFGEVLGTLVKDGLLALADFVKNVDIAKLFEDAKKVIDELWPAMQAGFKITVNAFKLLVAVGKPVLAFLAKLAVGISDGIEMFKRIVAKVGEFVNAVMNDPHKAIEMLKNGLKAALDFIAEKFDEALVWVSEKIDGIFKFFADLPKKIGELGPKLLTVGKNLITLFFEGMAAVGGLAEDFSKKIANSLIRFLNRSVIAGLNSGLKLVVDTLNKLPFFSLDLPKIPDIPQLAKGGLAVDPTIAAIAETGKKEAVLPLESPRAMKAVGQAIASEGGSLPAQRAGLGSAADGVIVQVLLGNDQLVPHTVRVVNRVNTQTARTITQKPRRV